MTEQELREKIKKIVAPYISAWGDDDAIVDSLIANGIGDVSEWKRRAEVLRLALSKSVLDENAIFDDDVCRYVLSNTKLTEEYYIEQAEKELQEERKDE